MALLEFHDPKIERFEQWWKRPATAADRFNGAICGGVAGFWLGALGLIALESPSMSLVEIALAAASGVVVGRRFPKASILIFSPFTLFGISPG
jgi:hypothetical protein